MYWIIGVIIIIDLLASINHFIHGIKTKKLDIFLNIITFFTVIMSFYFYGRIFGLISATIALGLPLLCMPLAALLVSNIRSRSGHGGKFYPGLPPNKLRTIEIRVSQKINKNISNVDEIDQIKIVRDNALDALLDYAFRKDKTALILSDFNINRQQLKIIYEKLISVGAGKWAGGHFVAASAITYPKSLLFTIKNFDKNPEGTSLDLLRYFERGFDLKEHATCPPAHS